MAFTAAPLPSLGLVIDTGKSDPGLFSLTRSDLLALTEVDLYYGRKMPSAYGSFALNGQDVTLTESTPVAHAAAPIPPLGFLTLATSGQYVLISEFGTFAETGQDATLRKGRAVSAAVGAFAVSGAPAQRDMEMNGDYRQFTASGQSATLSLARKITGERGSFVLLGQESTGVVGETSTDKVMPSNAGYFWLNWSFPPFIYPPEATFIRGFALMAGEGALAVNGQNATLDGPVWQDATPSSGTWVYVTPSGGTWTDVDPDS